MRKKFTMLLASLLLTVGKAWAQPTATEPLVASQNLPSMGTPENLFYVKSTKSGGNYWKSNTVNAGSLGEAGKFAFYAVPGLTDCYYIYSVNEQKWVNYNKTNRNNQKNFVELTANFDANAYWEITSSTKTGDQTACYQMRPTKYTTSQQGILAIQNDRYANWFQGADDSSTLGLWQQSPVDDEGSAWSLVSVDVTGDLNALLAQRIATANEVVATNATYTKGNGILTADNVEDIVSSPYTRTDEGGIGGLVDGSVSDDGRKYWHSDWAREVVNGTHYFKVDLGEAAYDLLSFSFSRRSAAADDHITRWAIYGVPEDETGLSNDSRNGLTLLAMVSTPFGNPTESFNNLPPFKTKGFKKFRFYADATNRNRGYFHLGEFQLYGNTFADDNTDNMKALVAALATAEGVTNATQSDIDVLNEKIAPFLASEENKAKAAAWLECVGPGYPKANSTARTTLQGVMEGKDIIASALESAMNAYIACTDILLPEDGKAYTFANYNPSNSGTIRYLNYTAGSALTISSTEPAAASVFVCRQLRDGVYAFVTEDGKVMTWMGGADGFLTNGTRYGYSDYYATTQDEKSDWNEITVKKNGTSENDLGHLRLVGRRSNNKISPFVVNKDGTWNHNGSDYYYLQESFTTAWIITEITHTNTDAQTLAVAKIDAKEQVKGMKLGGYCLTDKDGDKLYNTTSAHDAIDAATTIAEVETLLATRAANIPTQGVAYYLKDSHGTYLDIHHLGKEANDNSYDKLATLSQTKQLLYVTGSETEGTWSIHTTPEGGNYLHQATSRDWNSWVSDAGSSFKWEVEGVDVSGTPHYMLKNISGTSNGYLGADSHAATNPLYVNQSTEANKLKLQLLPVKSITGAASTAAEWLDTESVDVTTENIPAGITAIEDGKYTQIRTSGEYFYINAGRLTGVFKWRTGSGSQKVNIVGVEVVGLDEAVKSSDYHWGATGTSHSNNTYSVEIPEDGLYYLRYYTETNTNVHNSDVDITYTLFENNVFIAADAKQSDGTYVKYYLYNNDGTLAASTRLGVEDKYKWIRTTDANGNHTYANKAGKYLGYPGSNNGFTIADDAVPLNISASNAVHAGSMGVQRVGTDSDSKWMATKSDGSDFTRNSGKINSGVWTSDYIFTTSNIDELTIAKLNAENNELRNKVFGPGLLQYHFVINGERVYDVAVIDTVTTVASLDAVIASIDVNLPQAGKYYRIAYDFGTNNGGVKYLQSTNSSVKSLEMTDNKGEESLFYVEQVGENLRLKSVATGKYLKENGNTRGLHDEGGNVTFTANNGKIKIQAPSYLHAARSNGSYYIDHCGSDGCAEHNFIMEEVSLYTFTVNGDSKVGAKATWNGTEKTLPASWAVYSGMEITDATLSIACTGYTFNGFYEGEASVGKTIEIESLSANRTFATDFTPAFFSENYGNKWVSIKRASNAAHVAILGSAESGTIPTFNTIDYANEGILWCFVGNAESFKIYNKVSGDALALTWNDNTPADGEVVKMTTASEAISWHLIEYDNGYAIAPVGNNAFGINSYTGQAGSQLKFYGVGDNGTHWNFNLMDVANPLTLDVEVDKVWESSPRVAELTLTIDGASSQTRILDDVDAKKMYLPVGATFSLSSMTYRGYTFNGFGGEDSYENATLPEGGLEVTASYTANDERTLFYSPRDGHPYRIPAIATAPNGDIFAICDYRPCNSDIGYGEVDLVCRVSSDNGVTWTEERKIADGKGDDYAANDTSLIWKVGYGDPAIVADRESNKILVMSVCGNQTCWDGTFGEANPNPNRVARLYIEHDGEKWVYGEPEEVTYDIYPKFVDKEGNVHAASLFIGAGKICQSRVVKKDKYYRLYCAVWNVTKTQRQHHNYVIYSDDFGQTWNVLGDLGYENSASKWGNEPKVEELPDGTVVLSSRKYYGRYFNLFTFDDNTYTTGSWLGEVGSNEVENGLSFGGNSTNGEIYKVKAIRKSDGQICDVMLQSIPTGNDRSNVAVYYKEMEYTEAYTPTTFAQGWTLGKQVSQKASCYSTMILQADGRIGFFFEEVPGGYCMIYIPYTLEDLTADQYSLYTVTSTITDVKVGTFYASEAVQIPEGVKAYVADENNLADGVITMTQLEDIIPAHTGAVLRGEADSYEFIPSISYGTPVEGNLLVGHEAANSKDTEENRLSVLISENPSASIYVLANDSEGAKFYKKSADFTVKNNKAYLRIPNATLAQGLRIRFAGEEEGDGGTTSIDEGQLTIDNGQLTIYDLQGRRVLTPTKGMYIVNGKKIVIK